MKFLLGIKILFFVSFFFNGKGKTSSVAEVPFLQDTIHALKAEIKPLDRLFFEPDSLLDAKVDSVYNLLTPEERAAQMIMLASAPKLGLPYLPVKNRVKTNIAANVLFLKGTVTGFKKQQLELDSLQAANKKLPLLYACDCEPSLLHKKWADVKAVKPASGISTPEEAWDVAAAIYEQMNRLRVGLNFAPVVDIGTNKAIIGNRSFGTSRKKIVDLSVSFVNAMQFAGVAATVKHFPGHGAVKGDTHKQQVFIDGKLTELDNFKQVIDAASPLAVLVGHITVRNNQLYGTNGLPATLSSRIIKELLRNQLGYRGLVVTDAMNMGAVSRIPGADYKAALAGNDIIVMPVNPNSLHKKITAALQKEDSVALQFKQSVKRVIRLKLLQQD